MKLTISLTERRYIQEFHEFVEPRLDALLDGGGGPEGAQGARNAPSPAVVRVPSLIRDAAMNFNWDPLLDHYREIGKMYHSAGLPLSQWYAYSRDFRERTLAALANDGVHDSRKQARIVEGLALFEAITTQAVAEAWLNG
jgi:hypothetical protein